MNNHLMYGWTLAAGIAMLCLMGCKKEKPAETPATAEAPAAAEAPADEKAPAADDRAREARMEAARKRRQAASESTPPVPRVRSVAEHVEVSRKRITADNYKEALDRLERAVGNLERALKRTPGPGAARRPGNAP